MTTLHDHRTTPPAAYHVPAGKSCVLIPGLGSVPVSAPPVGVYPAGPDDPVPAGMQATAWTRVVRDGMSVNVPTCAPIDLDAAKAARVAALAAECDMRFDARWHITDRVLSTAGETMQPASPAAVDDAKAHNDIRDGLIAAVELATTPAEVEAIQWPA